MELDRFTEKAMGSVAAAQETAVRMGHQQIEGEHIHLALAVQQDGLIPTSAWIYGYRYRSIYTGFRGRAF